MRRTAVIGTGLIGASIGGALRQKGWYVLGVDRNPEAAAEAAQRGLIDETAGGIAEAVRDVEAVVLACPVSAIVEMLPRVDAQSPPHALLLDTGSVKEPIVRMMATLPGAERAVGGHPLAGSERSGPEWADPALFHGTPFLLCRSERTSSDALDRAVELAEAVGGRVRILPPDEHDRELARASHLPQVISSLLAGMRVNPELAGRGFRDMTRLAASDAEMWEAILLSNRWPILDAVREYQAALSALAEALEAQDRDALHLLLERGKQATV